ncbi:MAG TPA: hypothetical protein VEV82_07095 [Actinomycetota bacterium]|nr:hypothetical protein [Actinomycetota bacterium]
MLKTATTSSGHFARLAAVAFSAVALLLGGATPGVQAGEPGASMCTFTGGEVYVELQEDDSSGILSRDAAGLIFYDDESEPPTPPAPCGIATTATTNSIKVEDTSDNDSTGIILDLTEGHFANGGNEIPIEIDLALGTLDVFGVFSGASEDFWTFGFEKGNLQKDGDAEIEFVKPPDFGFGATAGANDHACSNGRRGTGGPSQVGWVFSGGEGADKLCGGRSTDRILGQGGDDTVKGSGGGDTLRGGDGDDRVLGSSSSDLLFGNKGGDGLEGGPGFDGCNGGPGGDTKRRCET